MCANYIHLRKDLSHTPPLQSGLVSLVVELQKYRSELNVRLSRANLDRVSLLLKQFSFLIFQAFFFFHFRAKLVGSCFMNLHNFPFDNQICPMNFSSCKLSIIFFFYLFEPAFIFLNQLLLASFFNSMQLNTSIFFLVKRIERNHRRYN